MCPLVTASDLGRAAAHQQAAHNLEIATAAAQKLLFADQKRRGAGGGRGRGRNAEMPPGQGQGQGQGST